MKDHFMKIATDPQNCKPRDFKMYPNEALKEYIFNELKCWFLAVDKYCMLKLRSCTGTTAYVEKAETRHEFTRAWNSNLHHLVCAQLAKYAMGLPVGNFKKYDRQYLFQIALRPLSPETQSVNAENRYAWLYGMVYGN